MTRSSLSLVILGLGCCIFVAGCDLPATKVATAPPVTGVAPLGPETNPPGVIPVVPSPVTPPAPLVSPLPPAVPAVPPVSVEVQIPPATPLAPPTETVKAQVGVGIKGRSLDPHEGMLVTPVKALFSAKERVVFDIQIPHALNLYQASEGEFPKTHEEFMEKIVQFNQIKLPQLPPGHEYLYDPETHELMVRRPAKK